MQLLESVESGLVVSLGHGKVLPGLCLRSLHAHDFLRVHGDGLVGVLHEVLVSVLSVLLSSDGLILRLPGVGDDSLDHAHDTRAAGVLVVLGEARGRVARVRVGAGGRNMRGTRLILLDHGVDLLHALQSLAQDHLREPLVGDRLLVICILGLSVRGSLLHLALHLRDCGHGSLHLLRQILDGLLEVRYLDLQSCLGVVARLRGALVVVQFLDAPVAVLDLVLLLPLEFRHHLVDFLFDLSKGVQLCPGRQERQVCRAGGSRSAQQHRGGAVQPLLHRAGRLDLHKRVHGFVEARIGLVVVQYLDGIIHRGDLSHAVLHTLVELRVGHRALLFKLREECFVELKLLLGVLQLLE
mmetsp:Transcript_65883/g.166897  ORF Transcript_65883/g.166897 Transcript_65883/m.166897 type:complete len:354 (-) Transcript_65883:206-1267(-)